ncbi:hypothetical protein B0H14DRAFT_2567173 [Mycena olivaceomarginata]|nr:hypothetical protein B0H14DRAFT_2567173 [Mycena olivaceomarginata]
MSKYLGGGGGGGGVSRVDHSGSDNKIRCCLGGCPVFHEANELYPGAIQQREYGQLALQFINAVMERRRQAALHINFTQQPREAPRDAMHRQIAKLFLNPISARQPTRLGIKPRKHKAVEPVDPEPSERAHSKCPRCDSAVSMGATHKEHATRNDLKTPDEHDRPHDEDTPGFTWDPTPPAQAAFPLTNLIRGAINYVYVNGQQVLSVFAMPKLHALGPTERTGPCHHNIWYYAPGSRLWKPEWFPTSRMNSRTNWSVYV